MLWTKKTKNLKSETMPIWANPEMSPFLRFINFFFNSMFQEDQNEKSPKLNGPKSKKWLCYKPEKLAKTRTSNLIFLNILFIYVGGGIQRHQVRRGGHHHCVLWGEPNASLYFECIYAMNTIIDVRVSSRPCAHVKPSR